jgi:thioredoxin 1
MIRRFFATIVQSRSGYNAVLSKLGDNKKNALLYFTATWCPPCRAIGPEFEKLSIAHGEKLEFAKIDVDDNQDLAGEYNVSSIPAFFVIDKNETVIETFSGASKERLEMIAKKYSKE